MVSHSMLTRTANMRECLSSTDFEFVECVLVQHQLVAELDFVNSRGWTAGLLQPHLHDLNCILHIIQFGYN